MEISTKCINECFDNFKKINKCDQKIAAYVLCVLGLIIVLTLVVLCLADPSLILYEVYNFESKERTFYIAVTWLVIMFFVYILVIYGLKKDKSWCILFWVVIMIISWNVHLVASVISIVNYVIDGLEKEIEKTSQRTIILFCVQAIWLVMIAYMWYYWKRMKDTNNVANLVQYISERSTSAITMARQRRLDGVDRVG